MEKSNESYGQKKQIYDLGITLSKLATMDRPLKKGSNLSQEIQRDNQDRRVKKTKITPEKDNYRKNKRVQSNGFDKNKLSKKSNNQVHEQNYLQGNSFSKQYFNQSQNSRQQKIPFRLQNSGQESIINNSQLITGFQKLNNSVKLDHSRISGKQEPILAQKQEEKILNDQIYKIEQEEYQQVQVDQKVSDLKRQENIKSRQYQKIKHMKTTQLQQFQFRAETIQKLKNERRQDMESFLLNFLKQSGVNSIDNEILEVLQKHFDCMREITQLMTNEQKTKFLLQNLASEKVYLQNPKTNYLQWSEIKRKQEILYDKLIDIVNRMEDDQNHEQQQNPRRITSQKMSSANNKNNNSTRKQSHVNNAKNSSLKRIRQNKRQQQQVYQSIDNEHICRDYGYQLPHRSIYPRNTTQVHQSSRHNQHNQHTGSDNYTNEQPREAQIQSRVNNQPTKTVTALINGQRQLSIGLGNTLLNTTQALFPNASKNWKWTTKLKNKLSSIRPQRQ